MNIALAFRNCCNNICISTVADIPNTRKKRRVFPAISLNEIMIMFEYSIFCCWTVVYALTSILLCLCMRFLCMRFLCMPHTEELHPLWLTPALMQDFEQNYNPAGLLLVPYHQGEVEILHIMRCSSIWLIDTIWRYSVPNVPNSSFFHLPLDTNLNIWI